jgi:hypothetical protein
MASNSLGTADDVKGYINPYISLKLVSVTNLSKIIDMNKFAPYIELESGSSSCTSKIASESGEQHIWDESFKIDFEMGSKLFINLFDRDDYGSDTLIAKFVINSDNIIHWKETRILALRLSEPDDEAYSVPFDQALCGENDKECSVLTLEVCYLDSEYLAKLRAEINNHKNIVREGNAYTIYEVIIKRNDGHSWKVELRYSDFLKIKDEISQIIPGISILPFPQKTYFEWLSCACRCTSRFNETRINSRKSGLAFFLNVVLDNISEFSCETLNSLLKIPSP